MDWLFNWLLKSRISTVEGRKEILKQMYAEVDHPEKNDPTAMSDWFYEVLSSMDTDMLRKNKTQNLFMDTLKEVRRVD